MEDEQGGRRKREEIGGGGRGWRRGHRGGRRERRRERGKMESEIENEAEERASSVFPLPLALKRLTEGPVGLCVGCVCVCVKGDGGTDLSCGSGTAG